MRFRLNTSHGSEEEERLLEAEVRRMAVGHEQDRQAAPSDAYWQNLIIRTNRRVDDATSVRALSLSWAARVAIPGVVAILSFLIGLHYYAPEWHSSGRMLSEVVQGLPEQAVDSLEVQHTVNSSAVRDEFSSDLFDLSPDAAGEYVMAYADPGEVLAGLSDNQVQDVLAYLHTRPN